MAVRVRLRRMGNRNSPFYRVVAADARTATNGRFIENLGWYDPKQDGTNFHLKVDRVEYWQGHGAQLSHTVKNLLKKARELPEPAEVPPEPAPAPAPAAPEPVASEDAADTVAAVDEAPAPTDET